MPMMIRIFDDNGNEINAVEAKSNAKRLSTRCAALQRQLDSLYVETAHHARIGPSHFIFKNGRSKYTRPL